VPEQKSTEGNSPEKESDVVSTATVTEPLPIIIEKYEEEFDINKHPYLFNKPKSYHPPGVDIVSPQVYKPEVVDTRLNLDKIIEKNEEATTLNEDSSNDLSSQNKTPSPKIINEDEYNNISEDKLKEKINYYASLLRNGKILATDIPKEIIVEVKAQV